MSSSYSRYSSDGEIRKIFTQCSNLKFVSIVTWLFLTATSLASLAKPDLLNDIEDESLYNFVHVFWVSISFNINGDTLYYPGMVYTGFFNFCFNALTISICLSCTFIIYSLFCKPKSINGMFERFSKYHFIPLLCVSSLYIIGECLKIDMNTLNVTSIDVIFVFNFFFSFIGLVSLIFIYINTHLTDSKVAHYFIKQFTYGILMALIVYNFFISIYFYAREKDFVEDKDKFRSDCNISFSVLIGVVNLALTYGLKNIITGITNIFLYIGMIVWFFKIPKTERDNFNGLAEGIIDGVIIFLDLCVIIYLLIKHNKEIMI